MARNGTAPRKGARDMSDMGRDRAVLALIVLLPFLSGLAMLAPERHSLLGLANTTILLIAPVMVLTWPEMRRASWPGGRLAAMSLLVLAFAGLLALTRAPHMLLSLTTLGAWAAAMVAGRAMQLRVRTRGPAVARAAMIAVLLAGPLYALLLPLMEMLHGAGDRIDWSHDMPGFRHVRKMGHLFTISAAAGAGLVLMRPAPGTARDDRVLTGLALLALALAIWTGARGAWLALAVAILLGGVAGWRAGMALRPGRLLAVLAGAVALALVLPAPGRHLGVWEELRFSTERLGNIEALSNNRLDLWSRALEATRDSPLVGPGWGQYVLVSPTNQTLHAHNMPVDVLYAFGMPMGLLTLGVLLVCWTEAHRRTVRADAGGLPALMVVHAMATYALVSGTYFYGIPVVLTGIAWGICLSPRPATD